MKKTKLPSLPCEETSFYKTDANLKGVSECVEFPSKHEIGFNSETKVKSYIQAEISPCQSNCFGMPGDPHYIPTIVPYLKISAFVAVLVNSKSDFKNYTDPFSIA